MSNILFGLFETHNCEFGKRSLYEHDVVEIEFGSAEDFDGMEDFVLDGSDEAVKMVKLLFEFGLLTTHIIILSEWAITFIVINPIKISIKINAFSPFQASPLIYSQILLNYPNEISLFL